MQVRIGTSTSSPTSPRPRLVPSVADLFSAGSKRWDHVSQPLNLYKFQHLTDWLYICLCLCPLCPFCPSFLPSLPPCLPACLPSFLPSFRVLPSFLLCSFLSFLSFLFLPLPVLFFPFPFLPFPSLPFFLSLFLPLFLLLSCLYRIRQLQPKALLATCPPLPGQLAPGASF